MENELIFRISASIIFFALTIIRIYYTMIVTQLRSSYSVSRLGTPRAFLGWFFYISILLSALVYILVPRWLAWAELSLPVALRWLGVVVGTGSVLLLFWVHRTLGESFAGLVSFKSDKP